jgi:glycosyltransferase involved in cell wall biosynthesis
MDDSKIRTTTARGRLDSAPRQAARSSEPDSSSARKHGGHGGVEPRRPRGTHFGSGLDSGDEVAPARCSSPSLGNDRKDQRRNGILVLGTTGRGGISAVIEAYRDVGFYTPGRMQFIPTHRESNRLGRLATALAALCRVTWACSTRHVSLLHLHMSMRGSFWRKAMFLFVGRLFGVPTIIHLHGSEFAGFVDRSPPLVKRFITMVFDRANAVIVLSESWRRLVQGLTKTDVRVIGNFVPDHFDPRRAAKTRERQAVLFLGQLGERKGVYDLLPAFKEVERRVPGASLHCGGNGDVQKVRAIVQELGIEHSVHVPGWVGGNEKLDLLHRCSIFVLPSHHENLPMSIIEAMSCSMAIVSTTVGGIPELVDAANGMLMEPGDRRGLADALVAVLERDDAERASLGTESRRRYEAQFSPDVAASRMRDLYRSLGVQP